MELTSEDYESIAEYICARVMGILRRARSMKPPIEVIVAGAEGEVFFHALVDGEGAFLNLEEDGPLRARFPVSVSVTDSEGSSLECLIEPDGGIHA